MTTIEIPLTSSAESTEQVCRFEAARSIVRAASDLRAIAERMERSAQALVNGSAWERSAFPNTQCVREALDEYRAVTSALMFLDSALESAMMADRERAQAATDGEVGRG